jgi:serine/threonine protein kinase/tetratricopeptide (TPR) repeat protein
MVNKHKDEEAIFNAAIQFENSDEREAYLKKACGGDKKLRADVELLLKAHFEGPVLDPAVTIDDSPLTEGPGTKIGRYKLLQLIGEGGFGVVYMAEQEEPIFRKVALKIIKLGMDTKRVIARFEAERQALAMMEHPNIAKVLDAGATDTGRPYFVMELVKGIPITEYCDKNNLDTRQRLELFIDVCKAVQHAHQKGIIHRDIKPSNVMITLHDSKPVAKVIDFGIAKATQHRLTEKTLFTDFRRFMGTPVYMSPEQAEMSGLDVDTRSDIYSLGILLYELLTGSTPLEEKMLLNAAHDEMCRMIREEEPEKPSTRLSTLGEMLAEVAKHRHVQPDQLCKIVRGDLDWVVMKTLEKDRTRRYETAHELVLDIERHLRDEPVVAGPPSMGYRMKKFMRRNRVLVTSVAAVLVVLMGGIVASTIFAVGQARARAEAERQAKISQAVADFLENDVLASVEPAKAKGPEVTVRYILDEASENMVDKFEDEPLVEASIHHTLGSTYRSLGVYKAAEQHSERACKIRRQRLGEEHPDTLRSMNNLANVYRKQGRYNEAEKLNIKVLEVRRSVFGEEHPDTLTSMNNLANVYSDQGRYDEAEKLHVKNLEIRRRVLGEEHPKTLTSMNNLTNVYVDQGRYDEAEKLHKKTLEIQRRVLGEEHPKTLTSMSNLAIVYKAQGRYDEAEKMHKKTLEIRRRLLGEEHPDTLISMNKLAIVYNRQSRYNEAEKLYKKALEIQRRILGEEHPDTMRSMTNLASVYWNQGRYEEAEKLYKKALEIRRRLLGEEHPDTVTFIGGMATIYKGKGRYDEAEKLHKKTLEIQRRILGEEHPDTLWTMNDLAEVHCDQGRYDEAEKLYKKTLEIRRRVMGEEHPKTLLSMSKLAGVYRRQGRYDEAEKLYKKTLEIQRRVLGEEHKETLWTMNDLGFMYRKQYRYNDAKPLYVKALEGRRRVLGDEHKATLWTMTDLVWVLAAKPGLQEFDESQMVDLGKRGVELMPESAFAWQVLGWAHYRTGEWQAAVEDLDKSIRLQKDGGDSYQWFFLAMAHWQLNNRDEARQWYEKAVVWMEQKRPDNEELAGFRAEAAELLGLTEPMDEIEVIPEKTESNE